MSDYDIKLAKGSIMLEKEIIKSIKKVVVTLKKEELPFIKSTGENIDEVVFEQKIKESVDAVCTLFKKSVRRKIKRKDECNLIINALNLLNPYTPLAFSTLDKNMYVMLEYDDEDIINSKSYDGVAIFTRLKKEV